MRVVVAEKPSVARDLARVLGATRKAEGYLEGQGLRITWCHGHMAELEEPAHYDAAWKRWSMDTLPMLPERFELRLRQGAKDQFAVLRKLLRDADTEDVVNACDAGREGELIFRFVYELAGCRKPVSRLWVSSLTDQAIKDGWKRLRPGSDLDPLADAARCRAEADWLVGLNATRAMTCRARDAGGEGLLSVGRVQTPTLAMIVRRDQQIAAFVPETFWQVKATFEPVPEGARFAAVFFRPEVEEPKTTGEDRPSQDDDANKEVSHAERLDQPTAQAVAEAAMDRPARVDRAERRSTRERPPLLYDLTSLQRRANQRYGLSAQRTLDIAQALYERHKLITYPRTDARYLLPDQVPELAGVLAGLRPVPPYTACVDDLLSRPIAPGPRVVNPAEVGDHPAILPTGRTPSSSLDPDEKRVFDLVARRLLAALSADALFDVTRLVVAIDLPEPVAGLAPPLRFRTRGRVCRQQGWRAIDPPGKQVDLDLPPVETGDPLLTVGTESTEGVTRPPRPHNDASILRSMETAGRELDDEALARVMRGCGLGTPATRAAILQVLLDRKYVERRGKDLRATPAGIALIEAIPVDALKSAELTAAWEGRLTEVAEARDRREAFMRDVSTHLAGIVTALRGAELRVAAFDGPVVGTCPACGKEVRERPRRYACDGVGTCGFEVSTRIARRAISTRMVKQLLTTGKTAPVKGFKSKAGKDFEAGLRWDGDQRKVVFWFEDRPRQTQPETPPPIREGAACPSCGEGTVIRGRSALGCSRWREGCAFRAPFPTGGASDLRLPSSGRPAERTRGGRS